MTTATPEHLLARFLDSGDEHALAVLFRRVSPALRSFALRLGAPRDRADDLVHETLVAAVQQAATFDETRPLLPWLQGILVRKVASFVRDELRRARHHAAFAGQDARAVPQPVDEAIRGEIRALLAQAITAVPTRYRRALELHLLHGLGAGEVAQRLGRNQVTVRVHLFRGLRALRRQLPRGLAPLLLAMVWPARPAMAGVCGGAARGIRFGLFAATAVAVAVAVPLLLREPPPAAVPPVATAGEAAEPPSGGTAPAADAGRAGPSMPREPALVAAGAFAVTVRDAEGAPVAGVGITAEPACGEPPLPQRRFAVTAEDGVAQFAPWPWAKALLRCDRGGGVEADTATGTAELRVAGAPLQGRVVDAAGRPAAGAAIWLAAAGEVPIAGGIVAAAGADGAFALASVPPGTWLAALAADGVARPQPWRGGALVLGLEPGGEVCGRVDDATGRAVADAVVIVGVCPELAGQGFPGGVVAATAPTQLVRSDAAGRFGPLWLPAGTHALRVLAAGRLPASRFVPVPANGSAFCSVALSPATRCAGEVVDEHGAAVPRAEIVLRGDDDDQRVDLAAGDDGRFAFDVPTAGTASFCVRAPGHLPVRRVVDGPAALRVVLPAQRRVRARLVWPDGAPVGGYEVRWLVAADSALVEQEQRAQSDGDGWFAVDEVAGPRRAAVRAPGDPVWHDVPLSGGDAALRLEVPEELRPTARLTGRVHGRAGEPHAGARIFVRCRSGVAWEAARTGADGAFAVETLPPGTAWVFAEPRQPDQVAAMAECELVAGDTTDLELVPVAGGRLRYRIARDDDVPIDTALVTIVGGAPERRYAAQAATSGRQALPPGDYRLYAMGEGFAWVDGAPFHIGAGSDTELDLVVEPAARTVLALRGIPGLGGEPAELRLTRLADGRPFGRFTLLRDTHPAVTAFLPAGDFEAVVATATGGSYGCRFGVDAAPATAAARRLDFRPR